MNMNWQGCKNILCIRPDNMGDVIMSVPAMRALKDSFGARITILTSSMAKGVFKSIPEIDDEIIFDLPWAKVADNAGDNGVDNVISIIKKKQFDAAVIFTVYSQNPMPAAMLAYIAGIPQVLAYCRENPYNLINNWVADKEPYEYIKHQVRRDLDLVAHVGATTLNEALYLNVNQRLWPAVAGKLHSIGVDTAKPWLLLHAGVSERKRQYPVKYWAKAAKKLIERDYQVILTGSATERDLTDRLQREIGQGSYSAGGMFAIDEFICLIKNARALLSVNTGTVHIAAAVRTPVVVLYAQTNPQHMPWGAPNMVLEFPVPAYLRSQNEVIKYVNKTLYSKPTAVPTDVDIVAAVEELLSLPNSQVQPFREIPNESRVIATS
jgi:lipopolysaccharide heptosyltransferase II